ncbi:hypothetical protein NEOLEDRAFT_1139810 [Neolentinus lepideus HHB14362 ss-1]|uniref:Uncharacterized protein n=1 Tax=Neolentinus lepideus HHB14362 ss-1 TaxID=1314782 RepID=A0A165PKU6_9AGAM|nr:hypothetical protein NEOLEDRAFT_1139810 [Neolentinus lepideus HHB14362 ss-1]
MSSGGAGRLGCVLSALESLPLQASLFRGHLLFSVSFPFSLAFTFPDTADAPLHIHYPLFQVTIRRRDINWNGMAPKSGIDQSSASGSFCIVPMRAW